MKTSIVKHYFINEAEITNSYLAEQLKINHTLALGKSNIRGYFDSAETAIKDAYDQNYQLIMLHWQSTSFNPVEFGRVLIDYENIFDHDHAIFGHIIDTQVKDNAGWFGFFPMTVGIDMGLLNYKTKDDIEWGNIQESSAEVFKVIRSATNMHDDYTPTRLDPDSGSVVIDKFLRPGWKLISYAAKNNLPILNMQGNVRKLKTILYGTDHVKDFLNMSQILEKIMILENSTMSEWFIQTIINNQRGVTQFEILNEEFLTDSEIIEVDNCVIHPSLKDIERVSKKSKHIFVLTDNKEEFGKLQFLFKDSKILSKYGYDIDVSKCTILMEDIFKNRTKFSKWCHSKKIKICYLRGIFYRRNNIGLAATIDTLQGKLKDIKIVG
jgi:hypothetical protein